MNVSEALVIRLRELLDNECMSVARLSQICHVPASTIRDILNGKTKQTGIETINKIANGFDISIREFFDSDYFDY